MGYSYFQIKYGKIIVLVMVDWNIFSFVDVQRTWYFCCSFSWNFFLFCRVSSKVDAVLLSHPDILHLGALPYAMKQLGLSAPVYATEPVYRLGLLTMYDYYLSRKVSSCTSLAVAWIF